MDAKNDLKRTTLRLPQDLYDRIEILAFENNRSLNAEIISILEYSVRPQFMNISNEATSEEEIELKAVKYEILLTQLRSLLELDRNTNPLGD
jgi:hypothetical protein